MILSDKSVDAAYAVDLFSYVDMDADPESLPYRLIHELTSRYRIDLSGIRSPYVDEDNGFWGQAHGWAAECAPECAPPFTALCDFLSVDLPGLAKECAALLLSDDDSSEYYAALESLSRRYAPFPQMYLLRDDFAASPAEKKRLNVPELREMPHEKAADVVLQAYLHAWTDYILLQIYCTAYCEEPNRYGKPGCFAAFRRRHMLFDETMPYRALPSEDIVQEESELLAAFTANDHERLARLTREQTLHIWQADTRQTIVAGRYSVLLAEMLQMVIDHRLTFKRCKNCGRFFVPFRHANAVYCSRPIDGDEKETCRSKGASLMAQVEQQKDTVRSARRRTYNRMFSRKHYAPNRPERQQAFEEFQAELQALDAAFASHELTLDEYLHALEKWA